ncbi:MAG: bacteriohemerythrin [Magnetospirillum sp. WYHS-4]
MSYVVWQEKFRIGIPEVDDDHKMLFDLIDQFHEAYARGSASHDPERVFSVLLAYTDRHFVREEGLMRDAGYGGLAAHVCAHRALRLDVVAFYERFRRGEQAGLCLELLAFLKNWLHFHIMEDDMAFKKVFRPGG